MTSLYASDRKDSYATDFSAPRAQQYVAPPPMGYPMNSDAAYSQPLPIQTTNRGDGFWRGCCAALCCCCLVDMCF